MPSTLFPPTDTEAVFQQSFALFLVFGRRAGLVLVFLLFKLSRATED